MEFEQLLDEVTQGSPTTLLVLQVFLVVFGTLLLDFVQKRVLKRVLRRVESTRVLWDEALYHAAIRPLSALIWLLGITFAAEIVGKQTDAAIFAVVTPVREIGVITLVTWFVFRFIQRMEQTIFIKAEREGRHVDPTTVDAISKLLRLSVIITAVLVGMQTLGFSISGILAFGGVGGIAVGFAAKDLLANFFGGMMIYLDRPFAVGDWIRSPDRNIEGTVEKIGWRLTSIRTFDKRPLYVPNSTFTSIAVENPSRMSHRRIYETIGIRYEDAAKMGTIIDEVRAMLETHPEIDASQTLIVNFNEFAPSSLDFFVYTFTHTTNWVRFHEVKQDVLLKIIQIIEENGAEIAFPTSTLHMPDGLRLQGLGSLASDSPTAREKTVS
ncbi:MAG TPA: mechanosensitive ion channel family protein [Gammaproteobacteria bacterium]